MQSAPTDEPIDAGALCERDDAGRKGLLAVFEPLGNEGDLVNSYRRKLFTVLN